MRRRRLAGFTLAEALVAITIIALAGSALLLATQSSMDSSEDALERTIAQSIAHQIIDEALGLPYMERGESGREVLLGIESGEDSRPRKRSLFDDTDDYNFYVASPLRDRWGIELGLGDGDGNLRHPHFRLRDDYFDNWGLIVLVRYADEADPSQNLAPLKTSGLRAIEVSIIKSPRDGTAYRLATVRRVYSYVPSIN